MVLMRIPKYIQTSQYEIISVLTGKYWIAKNQIQYIYIIDYGVQYSDKIIRNIYLQNSVELIFV